jgi:hypothetical protein
MFILVTIEDILDLRLPGPFGTLGFTSDPAVTLLIVAAASASTVLVVMTTSPPAQDPPPLCILNR